MRAGRKDLLLFVAPAAALLVACAEDPAAAAGAAAGLAAGAVLAKLLLRLGSVGRAYGLATFAWFSTAVAAAATSSPVVAGASAAVLLASLAVTRVFKDSSMGGALYSFILTYFACECLAEAAAIGRAGKYLPYMLSAGMGSWVVPPPLVRLAFAVSLTYMLVTYFIRRVSGRVGAAVAAVVFGGVWSLLTVAAVSSVLRADAYPLALLLSLAPLILYSMLLDVARR